MKLLHAVARGHALLARAGELLKDPLLLLIRLMWGTQFALSGWGKLHNLDGVTEFFTSLGIPAPGLNAIVVATHELGGGVLFALGLASRITVLPLIFMMGVAYATSDREAIANATWLAPDPLLESAPFLFLYAFVLVLVVGPGRLSVDGLIAWRWKEWRS